MTQLVTLQEASGHLRRDLDDDDDADLTMKIEAASDAVMRYLEWTDVPADVPVAVKAAVLRLVGDMYVNREGSTDSAISEQFGYGYLPANVLSLLYPLRVPSVA